MKKWIKVLLWIAGIPVWLFVILFVVAFIQAIIEDNGEQKPIVTTTETVEKSTITEKIIQPEIMEIIEPAPVEPTQKDFETKRNALIGRFEDEEEYRKINKNCVAKLNADEGLLFNADKPVVAGFIDDELPYEMTPYLALGGNYWTYEWYVKNSKYDWWRATCILKIDRMRVLEDDYLWGDLEVIKVFKEGFGDGFTTVKKRLKSIGEIK